MTCFLLTTLVLAHLLHLLYTNIIAAFLVIKINSFERTYIPKVGVATLVYWMIWYYYCFLFGFKCTFNCIVQYSLYLNMDIGTMLNCTLVSSTQSQSIGLVFECALFWCLGLCLQVLYSVTNCTSNILGRFTNITSNSTRPQCSRYKQYTH